MKTRAIILAAGSGKRFGSQDKVFIELEGKPIFIWSMEAFENTKEIDHIWVVTRKDMYETILNQKEKFNIKKFEGIVEGGKERQDSVFNALKALPRDTNIVLIHDAARPLIDKSLIRKVLKAISNSKFDGVIPVVGLTDTIKWIRNNNTIGGTLNRDVIKAVQTPQAFKFKKLIKAYEKAYRENFYGTDDASLIEKFGGTVYAVEGDEKNIKITTQSDLKRIISIIKGNSGNSEKLLQSLRIGIGYDSHRLIEGRKLIIGGVEIPYSKGLLGHSDGDVLIHAIIDAILGSSGLGDIGRHFPDTEDKYKNISSIILLEKILRILEAHKIRILYIDSTIFAEKPKMSPFIPEMMKNIERYGFKINIKAKTNEGMGFVGREEGIAAQAVCLCSLLD